MSPSCQAIRSPLLGRPRAEGGVPRLGANHRPRARLVSCGFVA